MGGTVISARTVPLLRILACALAAWSPAKPIGSDPINHHHGSAPFCELLERPSRQARSSALLPRAESWFSASKRTRSTTRRVSRVRSTSSQPPRSRCHTGYRGPDDWKETAKRSAGPGLRNPKGCAVGSRRVNEDDMSDPLLVSYSRRAPARYGNLAYSREFVVDEVIESAPVPATVLSMGESFKPRPESAFPVLRAAVVPLTAPSHGI